MNASWMKETFGNEKPIVAMCHLRAMKGDPNFETDLSEGSMEKVVELARRDLIALQNGGVDAVMFSNEFSLPYLTKTEPINAMCMARVIGELRRDISVPFGVNVLWDGIASVELAAATGAKFVREIMSGVYASDFGLWNTNCGELARHRRRIGASDVKLIFNIVPEAAAYIGNRTIEDIARSTEFNCQPDVICVSGLIAGENTDTQILTRAKSALKHTPLFCNTGVRPENVAEQLGAADGAVVGTTFKHDGKFENTVDEARVSAFMKKVREFRGE